MSRQRFTTRLFWARAIVCALVFGALLLSSGSLVPSAAAAHHLAVNDFINADGTLNLAAQPQGTFDLRGWNVTLDSVRGPVLAPGASAPAAPNAPTWSALAHNGLNNDVNALAVIGSDVYVGGSFTNLHTGSFGGLNRIARYDTTSSSWGGLGNNGLNGDVYALAVDGTDLYVGGAFSQTSDGTVTGLNRIAKYNTAFPGGWSALSNDGLDDTVSALSVVGTNLYVGGSFTQTSDSTVTELNGIAKYGTGSTTWSVLAHNGLDGIVYALAVDGTNLYVGGNFTQTSDSAVTGLNHIAKYDTSANSWSALANNGLNNTVRALAISGTNLYVGGLFSQTSDSAVTGLVGVAKYKTTVPTSWSALANNGLNNTVRALAISGSDLYVGGAFSQTNDGAVKNLNYIAKLTSTTAVNVTGPQARINPNGSIALKWQTTSETEIAGFDVYRQIGKRPWKKINPAFVQAQHPGDAAGASYRFTDNRVKTGKTYRYRIQVWYLDGHSEWAASARVKVK